MGDKITEIVDAIAGLTVKEIGFLIDEIKKRFGIFSTFHLVPVSPQPSRIAAPGHETEKSWCVVIDQNSIGMSNEIRIIKTVREHTILGLSEAHAVIRDGIDMGRPIKIFPDLLGTRGGLSNPKAAAQELIDAIKAAGGLARMN